MNNYKVERIIEDIRKWFKEESGGAKGVTVNISGGKDSTVVAALMVKALGPDKVLGILLPNGIQHDIEDSIAVCELLKIKYTIFNIQEMYNSITQNSDIPPTSAAAINIAPRLRMTYAYMVAQSIGYRVIGTSNLSEKFIGYFTKWGDNACDFNPIGRYTCTEVVQIGDLLGLPYELVHKTPSDGLCGKTDEERFGFSYDDIDDFINYGPDAVPQEIAEKIWDMHEKSMHKR